jgi:2-polyprenyl-3-methyl-5-hydroxy-6-metoxy-1,4-benzoquinol methylase
MEPCTDINLPIYEAGDFHDWLVPSEPYDVVVCVDAVMCFRDQQLALRKIAQSLRSGGTLFMTAINPFVYNRIKRTQKNPIESGPVSHWLTGRELVALIVSSGFAIERSYTIMPRGDRGVLRLLNSRRLNRAFGSAMEAVFRGWKERAGLGQYRVVIARKIG